MAELQLWGTAATAAPSATPTPTPAPSETTNPPGTLNPSFTGSALPATFSTGSSNGSGSPYVRDGRWSTAWYTVSSPDTGQFIVNYGQVRQLTGVRWGFRISGNADQFTVDTSMDGRTWSRAGTFGNGQKDTWYGTALNRQGKYVRVTFVNPNRDSQLGHMSEIQLWGRETSISAARAAAPRATATGTVTPKPSPTATPTFTPTPSPTATATPTATTAAMDAPPAGTPAPVPPSPTVALEPRVTPPPEFPPTPTEEPTATATPEPTATALPATEVPAPTPTEVVEAPVTGQGFIDNPDVGSANCRVGPDEGNDVIIPLDHGAEVATVGEPVDGWQRVICNDQDGYVFAEFISTTPPIEMTPEDQADEIEGTEDTAPAPDETSELEPTSESLPPDGPIAEPLPTEEPATEPAPAPVLEQRTIEVRASGDTSVTQSEPDSAQATNATGSLPIGGGSGAIAVLTFDVDGIDEGTVVDARLVLTGAGETTGPGGELTALPGVSLNEASTTWNEVTSLGGQNAGWVESLQPGEQTVIDVTGALDSDGSITFIIKGAPDQETAIASKEGGPSVSLVITVETESGDPAP